ncbi:MAG: hypothetical protein ACHP82_09565 [Hyphomicrobiales bacterium]
MFRLQQVVGDMLKILVVDVVIVEPVSTPKFPANRDINREFRQIRSLCEILNADTRAISKAFGQIPYATEQGILPTKSKIITG